MNIIKAQYQKSSLDSGNINIKATIDSTEFYIPLDPNNRHYQAIQEWVVEGNTIAEAD